MEIDTKTLIAKRGRVKRQLTNLEKYLTSINEVGINSSEEYFKLVARSESLAPINDRFMEIQEQFDSEQIQLQLEEEEEFEERFFNCQAKFKCLLNQYKHHDGDKVQSPTPSEITHSPAISVKLPDIPLPTFSGNFSEWLAFRDSFQAMVLSNHQLSDVSKFFYLSSSLIGEPKQLIQNLTISEANFPVAWELLVTRYGNVRLIVSDHIRKLFNLPKYQHQSHASLRAIIDHCHSHVNALKALDFEVPLEELLLSQMVLSKLDTDLIGEWETQSQAEVVPSFKELTDFLERKCKLFELSTISAVPAAVSDTTIEHVRQAHANVEYQVICPHCQGDHVLFRCSKFISLDSKRRLELVSSKRIDVCHNCLKVVKPKHACNGSCRYCGRRHHSLLHISRDQQDEQNVARATTNLVHTRNKRRYDSGQSDRNNANHQHNSSAPAHCVNANTQLDICLLATARVNVSSPRGKTDMCTALLDSASDCSLITERVVKRLNIPTSNTSIQIQGVMNSRQCSNKLASIQVQSADGTWKATIKCLVVKNITSNLPYCSFNTASWNIPTHLKLADPKFNVSKPIDLLIGTDIFYDVLLPGKIVPPTPDLPLIQNTALGWVVVGRLPHAAQSTAKYWYNSFLTTSVQPHDQLARFWELDSVDSISPTHGDEFCEKHFTETHYRQQDGRYVVSLPIKPDAKPLGHSKAQALKRFYNLEKRLASDVQLKSAYQDFMQEYIELGHMQIAPPAADGPNVFFIPHHPIFKPLSTTTKLRVVFDASAKSSNGNSLNDVMAVGPIIQQDLVSILVRFRTGKFAITADIAKMYRQIQVNPQQRDLQRIFWRADQSQPVAEYQLNTVTYGTAAASFLATRALLQVVLDEGEELPMVSRVLREDFYVDDCITCVNDAETAILIYNQLNHLLSSTGFELRKWSTNCPELLEQIPEQDREKLNTHTFDRNEPEHSVRALGLIWNTKEDTFVIQSGIDNVDPARRFTKRIFLATVASIWDPLGLVCPVVTKCKILIQSLWTAKIDWDELLPVDIHTQWITILAQLQHMSIRIPRSIVPQQEGTFQIIGFADSSEMAYGGCLYLRCELPSGEVISNLICSKSRVAPIKRVSLPRLELCAALLLAKLVVKVQSSIHLQYSHVILFSDSMITLSWITGVPYKWKTFVANRVATIQELTSNCIWKHVKSADNPADIISRGTTPSKLSSSDLWWHGPEWLLLNIELWPTSTTQNTEQSELQESRSSHVIKIQPLDQDIVVKFSSFTKTVRVVAYCKRFIFNVSHKDKRTGPLKTVELHEALTNCVIIVQHSAYVEEIQALKATESVPQKSKILPLRPFLHTDGTLRVGGRLQMAALPFDAKHQFILPKEHHFSDLLILYTHLRLLHAGSSLVLSQLRQQFWIPSGKIQVRKIIHKCVTCIRFRAQTQQQLMGELPALRVQQAFPFHNVGVDYAGPILAKYGNPRSKILIKTYLALFVCMATKAIHIEVVTSLSTQDFLAAFHRFVSRRGTPSNIFSDNGTNFQGARGDLEDLGRFISSSSVQQSIQNSTAHLGIQWHFIPPSAPHFGGIWEAGVKAMKHHLRRTMGSYSFTLEELITLTTQIEGILNSRPLMAMSDDANDFQFLSPGHFLIGRPLTSLPMPDMTDIPINRLTRWQNLQRFSHIVWKKWAAEYLHTLQQRTKWKSPADNIQLNQLVLIKEDNMPPLQWKLARVEQLHPGEDKLVRVVTLRTNQGLLKRPIHKLVHLLKE